MIITLTETKEHLKVDQDTEDDLITLYIQAAENHIENFLNQPIMGAADSPVTTPSAIKAACLLLVANMYENREAMTEKSLNENTTVKSLLYPYRRGMGV